MANHRRPQAESMTPAQLTTLAHNDRLRRLLLAEVQETMQRLWDFIDRNEHAINVIMRARVQSLRERYARLEAIERTLLRPGRLVEVDGDEDGDSAPCEADRDLKRVAADMAELVEDNREQAAL